MALLAVVSTGCGSRVVGAGKDDGGSNVRGKLSDGAVGPEVLMVVVPPQDSSEDSSEDASIRPSVDASATDGAADQTAPDTGPSRVCTPGDTRCDGKVPQSCDGSGAWQSSASCLFLCTAGACTGVCNPGDVGCGGIAPESCDGAGNWVVGAGCPFACNRGACVGRCAPGTHQCSGSVRQLCDISGQWQDDLACPFICAGSDCAGVCVPGRMQCLAGDLQTCSASGAWQSSGAATSELLTNPGFDAGETGWANPGLPIVYPANGNGGNGRPDVAAQSPPNVAWLGGLNNEDDVLTQSITIPAGAPSATLSFYYAIVTAETSAAELDVLDVQLLSGPQAITLAHLSDNDAVAAWTRFSAPVPANLVGQTVTLQIHAVTNGSRITSFYVDTVSVLAAVCP